MDALTERSTFTASGAEFRSYGRAQSSHLQQAIVLPPPAGAAERPTLFDMRFRAGARVDGLTRLTKRRGAELCISYSSRLDGLVQRVAHISEER